MTAPEIERILREHLATAMDPEGCLYLVDSSVSEAAQVLAAEMESPCQWTEDYWSVWATGCGESFVFFEGGPAENQIKYCPYCRKPLKALAYRYEKEQEE